jgi:hypothetical protein
MPQITLASGRGRQGGLTNGKGQRRGGGQVQRVGEARLSPRMGRRLDGGSAGAGCRPDRGGVGARCRPDGGGLGVGRSGRLSRVGHRLSCTVYGLDGRCGGGWRSPEDAAAGGGARWVRWTDRG